jgi:DNA-binding PadR family transcriptional regulator
MSLPVLNILLALADGAKHGYAIKQDVEERTDGTIRLGPGTLYEAIQRLEDGALIVEAPPSAAATGQEAQRRVYKLTERGWSVLRTELRQLGDIVERARANPRLRKGLA